MKGLRIFSRILLGLIFIYSGFVKGVDPLGFTYKLEDYFAAAHMSFFDPVALYLAVILCVAEFVMGVALVFGIRMKETSWAVMAFMAFFTILTLILAITDVVSDCGCFGDAIKLTNWETFYKNAIFMVFTLIIFSQRNKFIRILSLRDEMVILSLSTVVLVGVIIISFRHLPFIDFRPWEIGNRISDYVMPTPEESEIFLKYRNTETGEEVEYTSKTLPWEDTVLMSKIVFVEQRKVVTREYEEAPIHDFEINDIENNSYTDEIIGNPDYQFVVIAYNVNTSSKGSYEKLNNIYDFCEKRGISFVALSGSIYDEIDNFRHDINANYHWYLTDETALKTIIRSNPGLLLLKNGIILNKWHYNDFPGKAELKAEYFDNE